MKKWKRKNGSAAKLGVVLVLSGLCCLGVAAVLIGCNLRDNYRAKLASEKVLQKLDQVIEAREEDALDISSADPDYVGASLLTNGQRSHYMINPDMEMPAITIDGDEYIGRLDIPVLGLSLPVMSLWSYQGMKIAPGRYAGSVYQNNLIIAANNYESCFGSLRKLNCGDPVYFTDMEGNVFTYEVSGTEQIQTTDQQAVEAGNWDLTLFTDTWAGNYRITVRCTSAMDAE